VVANPGVSLLPARPAEFTVEPATLLRHLRGKSRGRSGVL
jgi:hypothetical protein